MTGGVFSASSLIPFDTNGVGKHLDSVDAWLRETHPKDASFLFRDEMEISAADWPRWTRLWQQYIPEYVEATNASN